MTGIKKEWTRLINMMKTHGYDSLDYILYQMRKIFLVLEDVYSVGSMVELQEAIDSIGTGAGTIFVEAGEYIVNTTIDINNCGSIVIYGHGDNTVLEAVDGVNIFHITCCASLLIKTIALDISAYTLPATDVQAILINEVNDNIVSLEDVTIHGIGGGNFGIGVEINSNNCVIDNCVITQVKSGIFVNGADRTLITNNTSATNAEYGLVLNLADITTITGNAFIGNGIHGIYNYDSDYSLIGNNGCNDNLSNGIHLELCEHCTISANAVVANLLNGIYLTQASYCTLSGNNCNNNDSNTANPQGGIFLTTNSDFNTISANSCNNNNNAGAGTGYGIIIETANCDENVVAANNANGNDIDLQDSGTATTIEYYVQDEFELQDAINSIGTKSGIINLEGSFTITATITIDAITGGGSYIIRGAGSNTTLTTGDITCFDITLARSVLLQNFKIDASAVTGRNTRIIDVNEANNDLVVINNVEITGIVGRGWGIYVQSDYVQITNCHISTIDMGINISGDYCKIESNVCNGMDEYGIDCIGDYAIITNNTCNSCNDSGIQMNGGSYCNVSQNQCHSNANYGIFVFSLDNMVLADNIFTLNATGIRVEDSNYVSVNGNTSSSNITSGIVIAPTSSYNIITGNTCINNAAGYGIIVAAGCVENIVRNNNTSGNNWQVWDLGINSDFEYRCSTGQDIQDAIDSIAAKTGTITILSGDTAITTAIDVDGGGAYIIQGQGDNTILTPNDNRVFDVTATKSCIFKDFKIDAQNITTATKPIFDINEVSDNPVFIERVTITGDGDKKGYGIVVESDNVKISDCIISYMYGGIWGQTPSYYTIRGCTISYCNIAGIYFITVAIYGIITENTIDNIINDGIYINSCDYLNVSNNTITNCDEGIVIVITNNSNISGNIIKNIDDSGIVASRADNTNFNGNTIEDIGYNGSRFIQCNYCTIANNIIDNFANDDSAATVFGIGLETSTYNSIIGNIIVNGINGGAGTGYGLRLITNSDNNKISSNILSGNDINYSDASTGTILFGDDTVYGAGWNGDLGTATKNAIYDKIQLVIAGVPAATLAFKTITGITNNIVADSPTDTLTFVVGAGLTIIGTAATDTITFTNTITQYTDGMADARIALAHHDTLLFPNGNVNEQHMTAAQIGDLHAIYTDIAAVAAVNAAGLSLANTKVITSQDADLTFTFGRTQIDSRFADMMIISHRDMSGVNNYAFGQLNDGKTYINAPTGKLIYFHINDVEKMSMGATGLATSVPIIMTGEAWKLYCTNAGGTKIALAAGAAGTILTGNGVGAAPSFQAAAGGGIDDIQLIAVRLADGTVISTWTSTPMAQIEAADQNAEISYTGHAPANMDAMVNPNLILSFSGAAADTWSITVKANSAGHGDAQGNNLHTGVETLVAAAGARFYTKTVALVGTISPSDIIGLRIEKISSDVQVLYMSLAAWIERS